MSLWIINHGFLLVLLTHFFCLGESKVVQRQGFFTNLFYCRKASFRNGQRGCFAGVYGSIMHRVTGDGICRERCRFSPALAASKGWKCGFCEDGPVASPESSPVSSVNAPVRKPVTRPRSVPIKSPVMSAPIPIKAPLPVPIQVTAPVSLPTPFQAPVPVRGTVPIFVPSPIVVIAPMPLSLPVKVPVPITLIAPVPVTMSTPMSSPMAVPVPSPVVTTPTTSSGNRTVSKCGAAVNTGGTSANATCTSDLWIPTQNRNMHCYAYGGVTDPCALHNNNDANNGLFKSPINCDRDTFYLWDEPDTQGKSYTWAGQEWLSYSNRYASEILTLRRRGVRFTSPLLKAGPPGVTASNLNTFYAACGSQCRNQSSPSYINVNAVNVFVGSWNAAGIQGCQDAANYIVNEIKAYLPTDNLPWYITNWSRLGTYNISDQVDAMNVIHLFFQSGSPIERIYWFGATDYGGNSGNNFLTQVTSSGKTLGQIWREKCDTLATNSIRSNIFVR